MQGMGREPTGPTTRTGGRNRLKLSAVVSRQMQRTMYHDTGYPTAKSVVVLQARRGKVKGREGRCGEERRRVEGRGEGWRGGGGADGDDDDDDDDDDVNNK